MENRAADWLALRFVDGLGSVSYCNLIRRFGDPGNIFKASVHDLAAVEGIRPQVIEGIKGFARTDRVEQELEAMRQHRVSLVTFVDDNYPAQLLNIYDPPPLLYLKGELRQEDTLAVAVVGSRFASH